MPQICFERARKSTEKMGFCGFINAIKPMPINVELNPQLIKTRLYEYLDPPVINNSIENSTVAYGIITHQYIKKYLDLLYNKEEAEEKQRTATTRRNTNASSEKDAGDNDNLPKLSDIEKEVISIIRSNAEENGWINISELGINLSKRIPGFDPRNYQCSKLSTFLKKFRSIELNPIENPHNKLLKVVYAKIKE